MFNFYYIWTTQELGRLILGNGLNAVCSEERHSHCISQGKGCASVLTRGYMLYEGNTDEERKALREMIARDAQTRCRRVRVVIEEV